MVAASAETAVVRVSEGEGALRPHVPQPGMALALVGLGALLCGSRWRYGALVSIVGGGGGVGGVPELHGSERERRGNAAHTLEGPRSAA